MKRLLILSSLLFMVLACSDESVEDTSQSRLSKSDLNLVASQFNDMFANTLTHVTTQSPLVSVYEATEDSVDAVLEVGEINRLTHDFLSDQYFGGIYLDLEHVDLEKVITLPDPNSRVNAATMFEMTELYSENQKTFVVPFTEKMMSLSDPGRGSDVIAAFNDQVISSEVLTDDEKLQLIEYGAGFQALIGFFDNGGAENIYEKIYGEGSADGRTLDCSIDMRSVWAGAVVGLTWGAVQGGITGTITGSFTVPVLGTAVGGVGGAVFGGAVGFVSGTISSVATSLLLTCGRSTKKQKGYTSASCKKMGKMGLKLPSACYKKITYRSHKRKFKTRYKLKGGK